MATIETRALSGHRFSFRVVWREGGRKQTETFATELEAEQFRLDVRAAGERWPADWQRGFGYKGDHSLAPAARPAASAALPTLLDHGLAYAQSQHTRAAIEQRLKMARIYTQHLDWLGAMRVDEVTRDDVQRWLDELAADGLAHKTIKNIRSEVSSALRAAPLMLDGAVPVNPVKGTTIDADPDDARPPVFLAPWEYDAILAGIAHEHRTYVETLARTGMRKGEAAALRVGDVDLSASLPTITITRAVKRSGDGTTRIGSTKTRSGRRTVTIDAELAELLRERIGGRARAAILFDNLGNDGTWQRNHWAPAVAAAMLDERPRMHDLRHSHASWLLAGTMPLFAVSKRLGHKDIQTTANIYGHLDTSTDAASAAVIAATMATLRAERPALRSV